MKKLLTFVLVMSILSACSTTLAVRGSTKPLPPGQAKKVTGSQSAKPYAPGQKKKN